MGRREFLRAGAAAALGLLAADAERVRRAQRPPNVLFILADDLGYGDLSAWGRPEYRTPHLDRFARDGVRLTNAYTAAAVCTPTRCALITGRYPQRLDIGLTEPLAYGDETVGLPAGHPTVASLLKSAGYDTALVGKWHLGYLPEHGPIPHGFDEFYGILSGGVDYFTHREPSGKLDLHEGTTTVERVGYITDLLTDRAIDYVKRRRSRPFYLALHYTAPHWPWEGPEDKPRSDSIAARQMRFVDGGSTRIYATMMRSLDDSVARVLGALHDAGRDRDTLVVFTSDNGGERWSYNWPMSEGKGTLREGGLRVPAAVRWPGVTAAGRVSDVPVITMDWTATLVAAAGARPDAAYPLDGADLRPVLGGGALAERTLFWRTRAQDAARQGRWKLWRAAGGTASLYDVMEDPGEKFDRRAFQPDVARELEAEFERWNATVLPRPTTPRPAGPGGR
jgi:arylsulfatase A-like enzyme